MTFEKDIFFAMGMLIIGCHTDILSFNVHTIHFQKEGSKDVHKNVCKQSKIMICKNAHMARDVPDLMDYIAQKHTNLEPFIPSPYTFLKVILCFHLLQILIQFSYLIIQWRIMMMTENFQQKLKKWRGKQNSELASKRIRQGKENKGAKEKDDDNDNLGYVCLKMMMSMTRIFWQEKKTIKGKPVILGEISSSREKRGKMTRMTECF